MKGQWKLCGILLSHNPNYKLTRAGIIKHMWEKENETSIQNVQ